MNNDLYFQTLTQELNFQKDRLQNFIQHWLTVGEYRETVIRNVLRRHLPKSIGLGKGFIVSNKVTSTQIDILLYDTTKPVLFQEGELLILTPDAAVGAIEVKKSIGSSELEETLVKIAHIAQLTSPNPAFIGLFAYEGHLDPELVLSTLQKSANQDGRRIINCVSIGESDFVRYWEHDPDCRSRRLYRQWHAYNLQLKAPAYFLINVVGHLCPHSVGVYDKLWFPSEGKEPFKVGEKPLFFSQDCAATQRITKRQSRIDISLHWDGRPPNTL
jgi:hypothetical protein